jgi:hypothetical protein
MFDVLKQVQQLNNKIIHPILLLNGFKENKLTYTKENSEITQIINIQKGNKWTYQGIERIIFTINIGIYNADIFAESKSEIPPKFPKEYHCFLRCRIGQLTNESDKWFEITSESDINKINSDVIYAINKIVLPCLGKINSLKDAQSIYDDNKSIIMSNDEVDQTILLIKVNRKNEAEILLNKLYNKSLLPIIYRENKINKNGKKVEIEHKIINADFQKKILQIAENNGILIK